ncbi:hypothetical protein IE53DRAFT_383168 [Violaceomyces palustris]|uniref:Uncharacterized protein n=1 Tax=Violaceomyces palustris TaxID=1673888 RepID=A0ACD0P815_9BASI|nr:hypothetical protein IE53DRAFT_383168 [Violaceomyces palustris]
MVASQTARQLIKSTYSQFVNDKFILIPPTRRFAFPSTMTTTTTSKISHRLISHLTLPTVTNGPPPTSDLSTLDSTTSSVQTYQQAALESIKSQSSLVKLTKELVTLSNRSALILGPSEAAEQSTLSWLEKLDSKSEEELVSAQGLRELDDALASKTFVSHNEATAADLALFASVYPTVSKLAAADQHAHPSLVRYVSHISNLPSTLSASKSSQLDLAPFLPIYEGMPKIERKKPEDLKKKKKNAASADSTEASASSAAKPEVKAKEAATEEKGQKKEKEGNAEVPKEAGKKKEKKEKPAKEKKGGNGAGGSNEPSSPIPSMIDLRVGKIVSIGRHPDADSLYLEKVDFGEPEGPRTILSGLVNFVPIEKMENRWVVGVCNLKPVAMRGIKSYGMLLCATHKDGKEGGVEPVCPPAGSEVGDKVYVEGYEDQVSEPVLNPKKKIFEAIQPNYTTTADKLTAWVGPLPGSTDPEADKKPRIIRTAKGPCYAENFDGASLS